MSKFHTSPHSTLGVQLNWDVKFYVQDTWNSVSMWCCICLNNFQTCRFFPRKTEICWEFNSATTVPWKICSCQSLRLAQACGCFSKLQLLFHIAAIGQWVVVKEIPIFFKSGTKKILQFWNLVHMYNICLFRRNDSLTVIWFDHWYLMISLNVSLKLDHLESQSKMQELQQNKIAKQNARNSTKNNNNLGTIPQVDVEISAEDHWTRPRLGWGVPQNHPSIESKRITGHSKRKETWVTYSNTS